MISSHISPAISASTRTTVTITGSGFTGATGVFFGSTPADSFTVDNDTQITAVTTFKGAKTVDVTVTTAGGTSATSSNDHFTYYIIS
jgi:IPT/TIG domain